MHVPYILVVRGDTLFIIRLLTGILSSRLITSHQLMLQWKPWLSQVHVGGW